MRLVESVKKVDLEKKHDLLPLWRRSLAQLPPEVAVFCTLKGERHNPTYGIYCTDDGSALIGKRQELGAPSVQLHLTLVTELVRLAIRRWYSNLPEHHLMEAHLFPETHGYLAYCATHVEPVSLDTEEREELAGAVIHESVQQWLLRLRNFPLDIENIEVFEAPLCGAMKAAELSQEFIRSCREFLKIEIISSIEILLSAAAVWCERQSAQEIGRAS